MSDELNHASIIDGIRLCKSKKYRYKHKDMNDLERMLAESQECRSRLIVTDGVFSMDGNVCPLPEIKKLADKYMGGKASGVMSFGIKGGLAAGTKFIDALQLITRLVNIGDAKSLATHPASTTHRQLGPEELAASGVTEDLVRRSIGIEHIDDIIEDIDQALAAAK